MPFAEATPEDRTFMALALEEAKLGYDEGGVPVGSVMVSNGEVIAQGHNRRVQEGDPIAHGEMDCLRRAGRRPHYKDVTLYTTLSPCMMCTGTILQFGIPRVVIGEQENFEGNGAFLSERGVEVVLLNDPACIELMSRFIEEKPSLWNEDIAEED
jgi:cytosine deaminase